MKVLAVTLISCISSSGAFSNNAFMKSNARSTIGSSAIFMEKDDRIVPSFDPLNLSSPNMSKSSDHAELLKPAMISMLAMSSSLVCTPQQASAAGPDWGLFEGRTGSLIHPIMMGSMFLLSCSAALKGFQYRRQRTLGNEISALKKTLPASNLQEAIAEAESAETVDAGLVSKLKAALPIQSEIDALIAERKELSGMNLRDAHYSQGALLAFLGTAFAIEGPLNTYARAGKLFPGPHLYAGAGLVVLWAAAAACVPAMSKGNDTARSIHIAANVSGMGLFVWQIISGWPILGKVIQFTKWP